MVGIGQKRWCDRGMKGQSHQTESAFYVGELVSHSDFHVGPSPSNLYNGISVDIHVWTRVGCVWPTAKNQLSFQD